MSQTRRRRAMPERAIQLFAAIRLDVTFQSVAATRIHAKKKIAIEVHRTVRPRASFHPQLPFRNAGVPPVLLTS